MNIIELAEQAGMVPFELFKGIRFIEVWLPEIERFAALVEAAARADERKETDRLRALCDELLSELYVYRASKYLKDTTEAIRARGIT